MKIPQPPDEDKPAGVPCPPVPTAPRCPWCGRPSFSLPASALLDMVQLAQAVLADIQAALEEAVLP